MKIRSVTWQENDWDSKLRTHRHLEYWDTDYKKWYPIPEWEFFDSEEYNQTRGVETQDELEKIRHTLYYS